MSPKSMCMCIGLFGAFLWFGPQVGFPLSEAHYGFYLREGEPPSPKKKPRDPAILRIEEVIVIL